MSVDTKAALFDAAENAMRRLGYNGFSYADLAQSVGIRKASIHYHFPTKAVLSAAVMQRYHAEFEQRLSDIDNAHATGGARLKALIIVYHQALKGGDMMCLCVSLSASRDDLPAETLDAIHAFRQMMTGWLSDTFSRAERDNTIAGISSQEAASVLALLEGAHLAARAEKDVSVFDNALMRLRARIENG